MSLTDVCAALIIVVAITKFAYDNFISGFLKKRDRENGLKGAEAYDAADKRMRIANALTFLATTILSALILLVGSSSDDVTRQEYNALEQRVIALGG